MAQRPDEGGPEEAGRGRVRSPWQDTRVVVSVVIAAGVLAVIGAIAFRVHRTSRLRSEREAAYKQLGIRLVYDVHKLGVDYFSQNKQKIDRVRWQPFLDQADVVDAILLEMHDFKPESVDAARFANPLIEEVVGSLQELGGGVKMSKGWITSGGTRLQVWIFQTPIQNDKGVMIGKAIVCLKSLDAQ